MSQAQGLVQDGRLVTPFLAAAEGEDTAQKVVRVFGTNADIDTTVEDIHEGGGAYVYPTVARVHGIVSSSAEDEDDSVAASGDIVIEDNDDLLAVAASVVVTYGSPANNDTIVVDGRTFTKKAAITGDDQFTTLDELRAYINSMPSVNATADATTITITAATAGTAGNAIEVSKTGSALSLSAATLEGGEDATVVSVGGQDFIAGVDFEIGEDEEETAENLAAAILANTTLAALVDADVTTDTITLTALAKGTGGNSIATVTTEADAISVEAATLTGGLAPTLTGAFTVRIVGLNSAYQEITEDVVMNGTGSVNTTNSFLRINSMEVLTSGSAGAAVGNITATAATDTTVSARISAGASKWFGAVYTVPAGKSAFVLSLYGTTPTASMIVTLNLRARLLGSVFTTKHTLALSSALPAWRDKFASAIFLPEKTDIKLNATTSANNASVTAEAEVLVVSN